MFTVFSFGVNAHFYGAGYEEGIIANSLRRDPIFKMALDLSAAQRQLRHWVFFQEPLAEE